MLLVIKRFLSDFISMKTFVFIRMFIYIIKDFNNFEYYGVKLNLPFKFCTPSMRLKFVTETYEKSELNLISKHLCIQDCFLELGSCFGIVTNYASKICHNKQNMSFEVNEGLIKTLKKNVELNNSNVKIIHGTISKKQLSFVKSRKITSGKVARNGCDNIPVYDMSILDGLNINTLICDIEGAEYELFNDYDLSFVKKIFIEWHDINHSLNREFGRKILKRMDFKLIDSDNMCDFFTK